MRALLFALALAALTPVPAEACSVSGVPAANVFAGMKGQPPGHQPFFSLYGVPAWGAVKMTIVDATCAAKRVCTGTDVPFDRTDRIIRPRKPLPDGARIQITSDAGKTLLADHTIVSGKGITLPADWGTIAMSWSGMVKEGLCSPAGPSVTLSLAPKADADGTFLLIYLTKPDDKNPFAKLANIYLPYGTSLELHNNLVEAAWLKTVPTQLWVRVADGEGHIGPVIAL
jgi:hypothetical protein